MISKKKGFTLVELLVVISIIGLLATLATVAFTSARSRGRDAKRVGDMTNAVKAFLSANNDNATLAGCTSVGALLNSCYTTGGNGGIYISTSTLFDPSGSAATAACAAGTATSTCNYSIRKGSNTAQAAVISDFRIDFYLENGSGGLAAGPHFATQLGLQ